MVWNRQDEVWKNNIETSGGRIRCSVVVMAYCIVYIIRKSTMGNGYVLCSGLWSLPDIIPDEIRELNTES